MTDTVSDVTGVIVGFLPLGPLTVNARLRVRMWEWVLTHPCSHGYGLSLQRMWGA